MKSFKNIAIIFLIVVSGIQAKSQDTGVFFRNADAFFKLYVKNGRVDYKGIKANPEMLNKLLDNAVNIRLKTSNPKTYQAFWINTYNLSIIKGIVDEYPVKQPLSIKGFFDKKKHNVGGVTVTLNEIENNLLRAKFPNEPRFHFVLVCAGLGCPPIISEAYTPSKLEAQLQRQTKIALNNPNFIRVKGKKVQLSQIFEWYKGDFTKNESEIDYINKFRNEKIPEGAKVSYYTYDWTLNEMR